MRNTRDVINAALFAFTVMVMLSAVPIKNLYAQEAVQIKGPKNATDQYSGSVYGPITSNDTLWRVAQRYRQNNTLTIYQVMTAIYELNPDAFEQNNLNLMVNGAMLRLPSERYVARIDAEAAKLRAEQDEQNWMRSTPRPGDSVRNLKPMSPPVNQEDLASTKDALEQQLNTLDASQARQFDALRDQFAESISSVETLLEDNQKLYERIEQVNTDLNALRTQVEGDVQVKMDEQSGLINEMLSLLRMEQQARQAEETSSLLNSVTSPIGLTILSVLFTSGLLVGLGVWLLKRRTNSAEIDETPVIKEKAKEQAVDIAPVEDLMADPLGDDDDLGDDDLFNDDDLLDDVLSSELEDSLDDDLESFADLSDEMLVDDSDKSKADNDEFENDLFEEGDAELSQDDLDSLFDEETPAPEISEESEGIDISMQDDDLLDNVTEDPDDLIDEILDAENALDSADDDDAEGDEEAISVEEETDDQFAQIDEPDEEPEKPEISIDDLLEEEQEKQSIADKLGVDENNLDEDMLSKIGDEIQQQNQEIDKLADNIIGEIEQLEMMGDMLDGLEDDDEDEITVSEESTQGIQDLETLAEDLEDIEVDDMANAEEFVDPLSDELLAELQEVDETQSQQTDALSEELLNELEQETDPVDDLSDELLSELEEEKDAVNDVSDELLEELEQETDPVDDLSDELLSELEEEKDAVDDVSDELLDELVNDVESVDSLDNESSVPDDTLGDLDDLESLADTSAEDFALEQEQDGVVKEQPVKEKGEVSDLEEWLTEDNESTDTSILDELENTDFDELLGSIDKDLDDEPDIKAKLDNPDLDLDALLTDLDDVEAGLVKDGLLDDEKDFVSVESLIDEADQDDAPAKNEEFDLDVSLEDFTGLVEDNDIIDVDIDSAQAANLDLARAYIDMDDTQAARSLLMDVMEQGSEEQIEEAQALLKEMGDA